MHLNFKHKDLTAQAKWFFTFSEACADYANKANRQECINLSPEEVDKARATSLASRPGQFAKNNGQLALSRRKSSTV